MIAARQIAFGGSAAKYTAADYIQDSASWMLDGIENSRFGEHNAVSGVGAVWNNLVDGGATYFTRAFYPAGLMFGDNYVETENIANYSGYCPSITTIHQTGSKGNYIPCLFIEAVFSIEDVTTNNIIIAGGLSQNGVRIANGVIAAQDGYGYSIESGEKVSLAWTVPTLGKPPLYYKNGVCNPFAQNVVKRPTSGVNNNTMIGGGYKTTFPARYYSLRFHERVLSAEEIAYNYEIDKARFNI